MPLLACPGGALCSRSAAGRLTKWARRAARPAGAHQSPLCRSASAQHAGQHLWTSCRLCCCFPSFAACRGIAGSLLGGLHSPRHEPSKHGPCGPQGALPGPASQPALRHRLHSPWQLPAGACAGQAPAQKPWIDLQPSWPHVQPRMLSHRCCEDLVRCLSRAHAHPCAPPQAPPAAAAAVLLQARPTSSSAEASQAPPCPECGTAMTGQVRAVAAEAPAAALVPSLPLPLPWLAAAAATAAAAAAPFGPPVPSLARSLRQRACPPWVAMAARISNSSGAAAAKSVGSRPVCLPCRVSVCPACVARRVPAAQCGLHPRLKRPTPQPLAALSISPRVVMAPRPLRRCAARRSTPPPPASLHPPLQHAHALNKLAPARAAAAEDGARPQGPAAYMPRRLQQQQAADAIRLEVQRAEAETIHRPVTGSGAAGVRAVRTLARTALAGPGAQATAGLLAGGSWRRRELAHPWCHCRRCCRRRRARRAAAACSLTALPRSPASPTRRRPCWPPPPRSPSPPSPTTAGARARARARAATAGAWTACRRRARSWRTWTSTWWGR